jgi:hypothetical protein
MLCRNVVFVDIDGVLVNKRSWYVRSGLQATADPPCVEALNKITNAAEADIVISSTWRIGQSLDQMSTLFRRWGVVAKVIGTTPHLPGKERGKEIKAWFSHNKAGRFVILDDDDDVHPYKQNLVQTKFDDGLTNEHVAAALRILDVPPSKSCSDRTLL